MTTLYLTVGGAMLASGFSFLFSTALYSLREYSRHGLAEFLGKRDGDQWFDRIVEHTPDLTFLTAVFRQFSNIMMWVLVFASFEQTHFGPLLRYSYTVIVAGIIAIFCSISIPHAAAKYSAAEVVGRLAPFLHLLNLIFSPLTKLMHGTDDVVRRALGATEGQTEDQIEEGILSAVEEGEIEGVVDEQEREMIESVIEFRNTTAGHIMTSRLEMVALTVDSNLETLKRTIEESGHSRIPIYEGTLDHIVGIVYARDLIKLIGVAIPQFSLRETMRPATHVPETMLLSDLLSDFRHQNVHIALVLNEYGSIAGLVTIEDVLEELVGEISDEHEPHEPAMIRRIDEKTAEADARIRIDDLNRILGTDLPDDAGYESLGGFLSASLARIPDKGAVYENRNVRYTVIDAEPHRVNRVKIEILAPMAAEPH